MGKNTPSSLSYLSALSTYLSILFRKGGYVISSTEYIGLHQICFKIRELESG